MTEGTFALYDLKVVVEAPKDGRQIMCGAKEGDYFLLCGEMLHLPEGQGFSIYSLASVLPLLAAKQRPSAHADWMTTDAVIACPDPCCPSTLRIIRTNVRTFKHGETTIKELQLPVHDRRAIQAMSSANLT